MDLAGTVSTAVSFDKSDERCRLDNPEGTRTCTAILPTSRKAIVDLQGTKCSGRDCSDGSLCPLVFATKFAKE